MNVFRNFLTNIFPNTVDTTDTSENREKIEKRKIELHQYVKDFLDSSHTSPNDEKQIQIAMREYILHKFYFLSDIYSDRNRQKIKITPDVLEQMGVISHENFKNFDSRQLENFILFEGEKKIEPEATKNFKKLFSYQDLINQKLLAQNPNLIFSERVYRIKYNQYDNSLVELYDQPRYQFKIELHYTFWIWNDAKTRKEKIRATKNWTEDEFGKQNLKIYKDVKKIFNELNAESSLYMCLFKSNTNFFYFNRYNEIFTINPNYDKKVKVRDMKLKYTPVLYDLHFHFWGEKSSPGTGLWKFAMTWDRQKLFLAQILGIQLIHTDGRKDNNRVLIGSKEHCTGCGAKTGRSWSYIQNKYMGIDETSCACGSGLDPEILDVEKSMIWPSAAWQLPWDVDILIDNFNANVSKKSSRTLRKKSD